MGTLERIKGTRTLVLVKIVIAFSESHFSIVDVKESEFPVGTGSPLGHRF